MKIGSFSIFIIVLLLGLAGSATCIAGPFYPIEENDLWGYIDQEGNVVIEPKFEGASDFSEGLALFKINGLWGYLDQRFDICIESRFQEAQRFSEGLAAVHLDGK